MLSLATDILVNVHVTHDISLKLGDEKGIFILPLATILSAIMRKKKTILKYNEFECTLYKPRKTTKLL